MANILVTCSADEQLRQAVLNALDGVGNAVFLSDIPAKERSPVLTSADVLLSWNLESELQPSEFEMISSVKLLQLLSAGVDHIPFPKIPSTITIASNAGAYAEPMAEHVLAMILAIFKNLSDRHNKLVNGIFDHINENRMLQGSTCAILGFGGIGKATARLLVCFHVRILAINNSGRTDEPVEFIGTLKDLEYVLRLADVAVVALPLTNSTRGLIGSQELGWMKNDATIINVARGDIINEAALFEKLKLHPSFNAAIDTWWVEPFRDGKFHTSYPFLSLPNLLGSPHNSGLVPNSLITGVVHAAENVKRFLNHEPILGVVKRSDYM
jgi:glycerate dehydrogenase